jgi:hypothetical protein
VKALYNENYKILKKELKMMPEIRTSHVHGLAELIL